jgi:uncharacterized protein (DUF1499 family)
MRVKCSRLNADLHHELHVVDSPLCTCQLAQEETPEHYFSVCPKYTNERQVMKDELNRLELVNPTTKTLLCGDENLSLDQNTNLFNIVHQYIMAMKRFTN